MIFSMHFVPKLMLVLMTIEQKEYFLKQELLPAINALNENATAAWGKMNAWQMIEHLTQLLDVSSGRLHFDVLTPAEQLPAYKAFLLSDKLFRENTKAPQNIIGNEPSTVICASFGEAKEKLATALTNFFDYFSVHSNPATNHPSFGTLHYDEWIQLHYKHVLHHLRQFQLM